MKGLGSPYSKSFPGYVPSEHEQIAYLATEYKITRIKFRSCLWMGLIFWPLLIVAYFLYLKLSSLESQAKRLGAPYGCEESYF